MQFHKQPRSSCSAPLQVAPAHSDTQRRQLVAPCQSPPPPLGLKGGDGAILTSAWKIGGGRGQWVVVLPPARWCHLASAPMSRPRGMPLSSSSHLWT